MNSVPNGEFLTELRAINKVSTLHCLCECIALNANLSIAERN